MISKSFLKSSFIYSFVGALPLATSFILLPFYTGYLSANDYGMLALYMVFTALFQIILNFGLDNFIPLSYIGNRDDVEKRKDQVSTAVFLMLFVGVILSIVFLITGTWIFRFFDLFYGDKSGSFQFFPWGFYCVLTGFFNSVFKSYTNLLVHQQRPKMYFWCNITNFILTVAISIGGTLMYPDTLIGPMYGRLLSGLGIFIIAAVFFGREFGFTFHRKYLKNIWVFCYPMVIYFLILWLLANVDRYIILYYLDLKGVGVYDFAIKCTLMVEFFQNGLASAIFPKIYNIWNDTKENKSTPEVNRYFNGLALVSIMVLPLFLLLIPFVVIFFVKKDFFYSSFDLLPLLTIGFVTRALQAMFITPILYFQKTKALPRVYGISAVFQVGLSILLIKYFGLTGAAITIFLVKIIQVLLLYLESRKVFTFRFNVSKHILLPLAYTLSVILLYPFTNDANRIWVNLIQLCVISLLSYLVFRHDINFTIRRYLKKRGWLQQSAGE